MLASCEIDHGFEPLLGQTKNYEISICCFTLYPTVEITLMLPSSLSYINMNRIGGVMVSMLTSSAVGRGFEPGRIIPKTIKLVFVVSPLSMHH
jgi:hypothetical protein